MRVSHNAMAERAALAPNLSGLALHKTRPVGMEQEEDGAPEAPEAPSWRDGLPPDGLPPEIGQLIMQFYALASMRDDDGVPKILLMCQRLGDVCRVAKTTPWGSLDVVCGPNGTLYDRALLVLGLYRDCNNWHEFAQWAQQNIANYNAVMDTYTNPKTYFNSCCRAFKNHILLFGENLKNAQHGLINNCHPINRPWTRAFHAYLIRRNPSLFANLNTMHSIFNPQKPYLKVDYTYYAKVALARDGRMLKHIPGSLTRLRKASTNDVVQAVLWPRDGFTDPEFVALAQIAINSSQFSSGAADVEIFSCVPLRLRAQLFGEELTAQLQERFSNMEAPWDDQWNPNRIILPLAWNQKCQPWYW